MTRFTSLIAPMSNERSEPVGSPVKVVMVCFVYVVKPFNGEVVKVCSRPYSIIIHLPIPDPPLQDMVQGKQGLVIENKTVSLGYRKVRHLLVLLYTSVLLR